MLGEEHLNPKNDYRKVVIESGKEAIAEMLNLETPNEVLLKLTELTANARVFKSTPQLVQTLQKMLLKLYLTHQNQAEREVDRRVVKEV